MQVKRFFWVTTTPYDDNQDNWQRKEEKYKKEGTQQLQQAQLYTQCVETHCIRIAEGTTCMTRGSKTLNTQIGETSPETLIHLSYRSMSKAISCQKHPK
jgi:hypothetical protein